MTAEVQGTAGPSPGRLRDVDALRGFALLGIIVVNSTQIAGAWAWSSDPAANATAATLVVHFLITAMFATKFYLLFSFLFGYSFTLQISSAHRAGADFRSRFLRRLAGLFVIGVAHAVLLYVGDILTTYAVLGLVLLAMRQLTPAQAGRAAAWILGAAGALYVLLGSLVLVATMTGATGMSPEQQTFPVDRLVTLYRGSPASVIAANLELLPSAFSSIAVFQAPCAVAMFLLGLAAGKYGEHGEQGEQGLLAGERTPARLLRRVVAGGLVVGTPGALLFAAATQGMLDVGWIILALGVDILTAPALSAAYVAALLLLLRSRRGRYVRAALAPGGRLALTNYLCQSLLLALVFTGYGFGLYDRLGAAWVLGIALAIYAVQLLVSAWWVRYLRYGPAEWMLRAVTYARLPRMRH